jgi:GTP cyclohydrolase II
VGGDDEREYAVAAHMLASLTLRSVRLLTNNPRKIAELEQYGIRVRERVPHVIPANEHNRFYLQTKADRSGHLIDFAAETSAAEQDEVPIIAGDA